MFIIFLSSLERERERDYVLKDYSFTTIMPVRTSWVLLYCAQNKSIAVQGYVK